MKYSFLILLVTFILQVQVQSQPQKWNRQMQLKSCNIRIVSGQFTASSFIEMEFYNPNDQELEGLHQFQLNPGQVITAFQLELNGKYRDGTLEEKWKATNAYNSIVGKRIDPALLTMDQNNFYSLRIYPVPAKGSRKITFTIQQLLKVDNGRIHYVLPLSIPDTVKSFRVSIVSNTSTRPQSGRGLISGKRFDEENNGFKLDYSETDMALKLPISFSVSLSREPALCLAKLNNVNHFAIRIPASADSVHALKAEQLTVFWDASASAKSRDIEKEIRFLQHFVAYNSIRKLTIIPFNHRLKDTSIFEIVNGNHQAWKQYLRTVQYNGATQLGCIVVPKNKAGVLMLFSDGVNSYGSKSPITNGALIFCVNSSSKADRVSLKNIAGSSGGKLIDLATTTITAAIVQSSTVQNWLMDVTSATGKSVIEQQLPMQANEFSMINGTSQQADTLFFHYGNGNIIAAVRKVVLQPGGHCEDLVISRIAMLEQFDQLIKSNNWEQILDVGLQENIVTPNTAFIVLERIEDYIRYNIEAPADLQKECEALQYVKSNTRIQRQQVKQQDEFAILNTVVEKYNQQFKKVIGAKGEIALSRKDIEEQKRSEARDAQAATGQVSKFLPQGIYGLSAGNSSLDEVVVTGYGTQRKSSLTGSVTHVRSTELQGFNNVAEALQGRVAGLTITRSEMAPGSASSIMIRGISSLRGNGQPLFILDAVPVQGNIDDLINVNNIQDITVLRGVQASALYGSQAANGVIVINSKKGGYNRHYDHNRSYRLKDMEDVQYMQEIKAVSLQGMREKYEQLQELYAGEPNFYFDMAMHFFDKGLKEDAYAMLMEAAEQGYGNQEVQHAVAYVLESWKMYQEAVVVYEALVAENPGRLVFRRDLAWVLYQAGDHQSAINTFYEAITLKTNEQEQVMDKVTMLYEMNQVIGLHKNTLDISMIPAALIQELPSDLRIVLNSNSGHLGMMRVKEPGGAIVSVNSRNQTALMYGNDRWGYSGNTAVYQVNNARAGKYKLLVNYYSSYQSQAVPSFVRIKTFKNFGNAKQSIEIENVIMDNQHGEIEIATVSYEKSTNE